MFCDACGASVDAGQSFCSRCGKQIIGPVTAIAAPRSRVQQHVQLLGILWFAISALNAVGGVVLYIVANTIFANVRNFGMPEGPTAFLRPLLSVVAILILAKATFGFIAGWGLLRREPWARLMTLVLAFLALFNIPFGTAIGVYTLWVLLPTSSEREYEALAAEQAA
jgi:hypothetical protein